MAPDMTEKDTTDITLFVRTSREDIASWDRRKIVEALMRETTVDRQTAEKISRDVERQIIASGMELLTAALIREMVNAKLIEQGLGDASTMHARLGFPLYDVRQIILNQNKENANVPHSPESTNLTLAEGIKKEYAVLDIFSRDIGYAHMVGDIHIHNLGYIDRPYAACQSLEYIKRFGLNLPASLAVAAPARHAEVLVSHMVRCAAALQGNYAGAIAWDGVNVHFAPYIRDFDDKKVYQLAQRLVYEFAQQAVGRGGQTIFTDIHLYWDLPVHMEGRPVIGPGGSLTEKTYGEYRLETRRMAEALISVFKTGDAAGLPFVFPRPMLHLSRQFFREDGHENFLLEACAAAAARGNIHFIFDREGVLRLSECACSPPPPGNSPDPLWTIGRTVLQNVSINLPRLGYRSGGDDGALFKLLTVVMEQTAQAHLQKRHFIERLLSLGDKGPLSMLTLDEKIKPFFSLESAVHLIGMVGLNELCAIHRGAELHQSDEALSFGLSVITHMKDVARCLTDRHGVAFALQQTPAESTPYRFARLDLKHFSPVSGRHVKGDIARGAVYYTNSTHFNVAADLDPFDRVRREGLFHPFIEGDVMTALWLGDAHPSPEELARFVERTFRETKSQHILFSPDFTFCKNCRKTLRGLSENCRSCGSSDVEGISRITGYFSRISKWNRGKLAELRNRRHWGSATHSD
ncbi:MAG: anaerobic ribonucleoside-triphosphate reductase [Deltaproteobacteria bacterium]|nr:anaerobic ribonucleoside-triphosphate reductase [Deltaproteobacteria bacterium]